MELDEGQRYYLKPMNCPFHILIFKSRQRSYRELPLRMFEFGAVYRYEKSGVVHGLTRVRGMTQDDAHIFCSREQMAGELRSLLAFVLDLLRDFGLEDFYLELSTMPEEKAVGTLEEWEEATEALREAALAMDLELVLDPGGGAFYGPKISVQARDAIGRTWQISTIQVDTQLPQRFDMDYVGQDNTRHRPIMIHRALFGSVERFFAVLVEHYAGAFPTWLSPVQARVLPVRDDHTPYARQVRDVLVAAGVRAEADDAGEPLGARIRRREVGEAALHPRCRRLGRGAGNRGRQRPGFGRARARCRSRRARREAARGGGRAGRARPWRGRRRAVSLDHLWAGWRSSYVSSFSSAEAVVPGADGPAEAACVFCAIVGSGEPDETHHVLWTGALTVALLNAFPYSPGHVMVMPLRHVRDLCELEAEEAAELSSGVYRAVAAVKAAYSPEGMNLGLNLGRAAGAGIPPICTCTSSRDGSATRTS